jgi:hypothetical protein
MRMPTRDEVNAGLHNLRLIQIDDQLHFDEDATESMLGCIAGYVSDEDVLFMKTEQEWQAQYAA